MQVDVYCVSMTMNLSWGSISLIEVVVYSVAMLILEPLIALKIAIILIPKYNNSSIIYLKKKRVKIL